MGTKTPLSLTSCRGAHAEGFVHKKVRCLISRIFKYRGLFLWLFLGTSLVFKIWESIPEDIDEKSGILELRLLKLERKSHDLRAHWQLVNQPERLLWSKLETTKQIKEGDILLLEGRIQAFPLYKNQDGFNYFSYLKAQGFSGQLFIDRMHSSQGQSRNIRLIFREYQRSLLQRIDHLEWKPESKAILKAILLGYKDELNQDLKSKFKNAGALHLLAVSGLHIGILYFLIELFLKAVIRNKPKLILIFSCLGLWVFALICGASPSVLRAVSMFSFIGVGRYKGRSLAGLRSLFYSGALWLWINPIQWYSLGFQFSYLAVLGIFLFQGKFEDLYLPNSKPLQWIFRSIYLSLSCQLLTLPLVLVHFQQFPLYSILSSLILTPLLSLIMYLGLVLLGTGSLIPILSAVTERLLDLMLFLIQEIHKLPMAVMEINNFSNLSLTNYYLVVGSLFLRRTNLGYLLMAIAFGLSGLAAIYTKY